MAFIMAYPNFKKSMKMAFGPLGVKGNATNPSKQVKLLDYTNLENKRQDTIYNSITVNVLIVNDVVKIPIGALNVYMLP
jgi:hypothetical protein